MGPGYLSFLDNRLAAAAPLVTPLNKRLVPLKGDHSVRLVRGGHSAHTRLFLFVIRVGPGYLSFLDNRLAAAAPLVTVLIYLARTIEQYDTPAPS
jgi:hypothetical protein